MPAWLGWVAVVLLSLYLAVYPALAAGLAWRFGHEQPARAGARARRRLASPNGCARRVHRLRLEPARRDAGRYAAGATAAQLDRHLRPVAFLVLLGGGDLADWHAPAMAALGRSGRLRRSLFAVTVRSAMRPARARSLASRSASSSPTSASRTNGAPGFEEEAARRLGSAVDEARRTSARACCSGPKPRSPTRSRTPRTGEHQAMRRSSNARAPRALVGPGEYLLTGGIAVISTRRPLHRRRRQQRLRARPAAASVVGRYDKAHLVPYGEYLPMRPLLSAIGLSRLAPGDIDFNAGPGPRTIDLPGLGQGRLPALLRDHLLGRGRRPRQPPRLHLQPVERRLVRPLGPAAASRPGAAARGRGGHPGDPLDARPASAR